MRNRAEKERRKALKQQVKQIGRVEKLTGVPLPEVELRQLFHDVNIQVEATGCDHTLNHTHRYLQQRQISKLDEVLNWLRDNGGYCDCEVVANVEEVVNELFGEEYEVE